jgi:hypothetical protein
MARLELRHPISPRHATPLKGNQKLENVKLAAKVAIVIATLLGGSAQAQFKQLSPSVAECVGTLMKGFAENHTPWSVYANGDYRKLRELPSTPEEDRRFHSHIEEYVCHFEWERSAPLPCLPNGSNGYGYCRVIGTIGLNPNTGLDPRVEADPGHAKVVWLKDVILVEVPH